MDCLQSTVFMMGGRFGSAFTPNPTSYLFQDNWLKGPWAQLPGEQVVIFGLKIKFGNA
jgi:hypothetical protein